MVASEDLKDSDLAVSPSQSSERSYVHYFLASPASLPQAPDESHYRSRQKRPARHANPSLPHGSRAVRMHSLNSSNTK